MGTLRTLQTDIQCHNSPSNRFRITLLAFCALLFYIIFKNTITGCQHAENSTRPFTTNLNTAANLNTAVNSNTAVCVSGQIRTLTMQTTDENHPKTWQPMRASIPYPNQTVAESIQHNLYPKLNKPDVFMVISTRQSEREPKQGDMSVCEPLRPNGGYLNCSVPLEKPMEYLGNESFRKDFAYPYYVGIQGLIQQMKGMYDCYKQIQKYSIATGKKYEWIVRLRPDMYIYEFPNIEDLNAVKNVEKKILNANRKACCCGNQDTFAVGKYDMMGLFLERFIHFQQGDILQNGTRFTSESHLEKYMKERGVSLEDHPLIKTCLVKPKYRKTISQP